jgi:hypothetical protein
LCGVVWVTRGVGKWIGRVARLLRNVNFWIREVLHVLIKKIGAYPAGLNPFGAFVEYLHPRSVDHAAIGCPHENHGGLTGGFDQCASGNIEKFFSIRGFAEWG